jgi:hypothetical protein
MKNSDARVNGWAQQSILPPEHLKIALTVHVDAAQTSAQVGVKITDHGEGIILGMYTCSVPISATYVEIEHIVSDLLLSALTEHHSPF